MWTWTVFPPVRVELYSIRYNNVNDTEWVGGKYQEIPLSPLNCTRSITSLHTCLMLLIWLLCCVTVAVEVQCNFQNTASSGSYWSQNWLTDSFECSKNENFSLSSNKRWGIQIKLLLPQSKFVTSAVSAIALFWWSRKKEQWKKNYHIILLLYHIALHTFNISSTQHRFARDSVTFIWIKAKV